MTQPFGVQNQRQAFSVHGPEHIGGISPDHARRAIWQRHHEIQRPAAPAEPARLQSLPEQRMRPRGDLDLTRQYRTKLLQSVAFVLVIDEAHMLDHDQLESIRMMTNHDMDSSTPFATILVGQPTLRHSVKLGVLAALEQRITVRYQMKGMTPDETASYVRHHLEQAGRTAELFTDDAVAQIHHAARGKPRTVNNICTAALIATAGAGKNLVDHASARAAIAEVTATD